LQNTTGLLLSNYMTIASTIMPAASHVVYLVGPYYPTMS